MTRTESTVGPIAGSRFPLLLLLLVGSGASCLIYEIVWFRALGLWFGSTVPAVATVLAAFMAGLALGNLLLGRVADRSADPLVLYRRLEVGIGLCALLVSLALLEGGGMLSSLARMVAGSGPLEPLLRFAFVFVLLMVPTTLMGGTLPAVARATVSAGKQGRAVGAIYAANTTGAVVGVLLPDLLLIPTLGMWSTVLVGVVLNLVVVLLVGPLLPCTVAPASEPKAGAAFITSPLAVALFAVSGFCAMGYEVVWSRLIQSMASGLVLSFSILLATYLAATAAGSWISRPLADRSRSPLVWAALGMVLTGLVAFLPIAFFGGWTDFQASWLVPDPGLRRPTYALLLARSVAGSLWIAGLPCLLMGLVFPFLAAAAVPADAPGRGLGRLVAINTLAGVVGSVLAGFLLLPRIGAQASLLGLASLAATVGVVALLITARRRIALLAPGLLAAALLAVTGVVLPGDHLLNSLLPSSPSTRVEKVIEGRTTMAAVTTHYQFDHPFYRELVTPGVSMSGTAYGMRRYMGLMGHMPLFFARDHERVALICYGVGNTARALLSHPDLGGLDIIDIAEEVLEESAWFAEFTAGDPLEDPRVTTWVDDGRHHLLVTDLRYDVITSEPPPPNHAGVVNLYSREYYQVARRRLVPGGVLAQWLPVFQLSEPETRSMIAAFVAEFEHTALVQGHRYQWILLGSDEPLVVQPAAWRARAAMPEVQRDLEDIGVLGSVDLAATFMLGDAGLRALVEDDEPLSDDRPLIQYPFRSYGPLLDLPQGILGDPAGVLSALQADPASDDDTAWVRELRAAIEAQRTLMAGLHLNYLSQPEWSELVFGTHMRAAFVARPCHPSLLAHLGVNPDRIALAEALVAQGPVTDPVKAALARARYYCGEHTEALDLLEGMQQPTITRREDPARYWLLRAGAARGAGRWDDAREAFAAALEHSEHPDFLQAIGALAQAVESPWRWQAGPLGQALGTDEIDPPGTTFVIRHVEKQAGDDPLPSEAGLLRAQALMERLAEVPLVAVYSTPLRRTIRTALPTAEAQGLEVTPYTTTDELRALLAGHPGQAALVVGHSNTVPAILEALGTPGPGSIDHGRYGDLYLVVRDGGRRELQVTRVGAAL